MKLAVSAGGAARDAYAYTGGKAFDARQPCVVFLHGALHDHSSWTLAARWFAHHDHSVLAPDLPGHGRSPGAPLTSVEAIADWLLALLDAAGVAAASFVGHSMGSLIALETAARAPERARHLVLVGTAFPMKVSQALLDAARDDAHAAIDSVLTYSHATFAAKPSYPGPGAWLHGSDRALMRRTHDGQRETNLFLNDFQVCDRYAGAIQAAARVTCAATIVVGARDQMTFASQSVELARALRAQTVTLPCGHALMSEAPDAVLAALRGAIASA
jgi:pimeloyl-ACP methyl ester carboxylesterase